MNFVESALAATLGLAAAGFPVFPCNAEKRPTCPGGFKAATRDPTALRQLWANHPGVLVGIPTGAASGIAVLDLDFPRHPEASGWADQHLSGLSDTFIVQTRSGGQHWYYRHRDGLRCSESKIATGVDVRADGGYVIWWPAAGYPVLSNQPFAPWPAFLNELLTSRPSAPDAPPPPPSELAAIGPTALAHIVQRLPNDTAFDDRSEWIALAHALAGAFPNDSDLARELWLGHAAKRAQAEGEPERVWSTLPGPHKVGADWIVTKARAAGVDVADYENAAAAAAFAVAGPLPVVAGLSSSDRASAPTETDAVVARLRAMDPIAYDKCRKEEARRLGIRPTALDKAVNAARAAVGDGGGNKQGSPLGLAAPEPWPEPVNGAGLLGNLSDFFARHLVLPNGAADLLAIWSVHTHCFACARHTPRLAIGSPDKQCGKTTALELLQMVACKPLPTANVTAAAVFRTVEACTPTLLVDEADTFLGENEGLRGVLNAGHKRGGQVIRCVGDDAEPRTFAAFAPAAIAAIGALPGTIADRSIRIVMRRATQAERPQPIRGATEREGAILARRAARWAADNAAVLHDRDPALPDGMTNREADNWRILFAIAEVAGGDWSTRLGKAAGALADADDGREGLGVALLRDVRTIFAEAAPAGKTAADKLPTAEIVRRLTEMEDRPWPELSQGKALTAARFTRMVKPFGIMRKQWRAENNGPRFWGFHVVDFNDAFSRYLPPASADLGRRTGDVVTRE